MSLCIDVKMPLHAQHLHGNLILNNYMYVFLSLKCDLYKLMLYVKFEGCHAIDSIFFLLVKLFSGTQTKSQIVVRKVM